ncbi:MAG: hypothetical protein GFH27_549285n61 [Chloroflexi bacterium AL-W]|nr:hypothetical protein [Chloroflexi bacterium AL-N1]NOK65573.1 hypothetical protein [Chloroflexi bacterium AL-N10]NOK74486.1 hypothetical protein [Chloroflexi bacterium AL-N5]NOK80606.1 hypothetical protein [Chloroflexi bacterium AL-W]NOK88744.1 hypothetical protein [Chloroflexi bacterium AL-N15]
MFSLKKSFIAVLSVLAGTSILLGTSVFTNVSIFFWVLGTFLFTMALILALNERLEISYSRAILYVVLGLVAYNVMFFVILQIT